MDSDMKLTAKFARMYLPCGINSDGVVNSKDLTRLMKYLAGEEVEINADAIDVNGDGSVNSKDLTRLMKNIASAESEAA